ncbi:MAG TPA: DUF4145 domain-containing protein [Pirellulaceae bacterium]|jgi:hypothetical protein|nr:DUF4145 domain-containing protein [Pirellulaceae bacterium]
MPHDFQEDIKVVIGFRSSLESETDRGAALMAAAYLEDQLLRLALDVIVDENSLRKKLGDQNGPLGSFSARIDFAYALGLLPPKMHADLHLIRRIRNEFAHTMAPITFETSPNKERCFELFYVWKAEATPRARYIAACMAALARIHRGIADAKRPTVPPDIEQADLLNRGKKVQKAVVDLLEVVLKQASKAPESATSEETDQTE